MSNCDMSRCPRLDRRRADPDFESKVRGNDVHMVDPTQMIRTSRILAEQIDSRRLACFANASSTPLSELVLASSSVADDLDSVWQRRRCRTMIGSIAISTPNLRSALLASARRPRSVRWRSRIRIASPRGQVGAAAAVLLQQLPPTKPVEG